MMIMIAVQDSHIKPRNELAVPHLCKIWKTTCFASSEIQNKDKIIKLDVSQVVQLQQ